MTDDKDGLDVDSIQMRREDRNSVSLAWLGRSIHDMTEPHGRYSLRQSSGARCREQQQTESQVAGVGREGRMAPVVGWDGGRGGAATPT